MELLYKDAKLYMKVSSQERTHCIPLVYGAKLDALTGMWVVPVGALLPIMIIFPQIRPANKQSKDLLDDAWKVLNTVQHDKDCIKDKSELRSVQYPFLMSHQVVCNNISDIRPRYAFFLDTGTR